MLPVEASFCVAVKIKIFIILLVFALRLASDFKVQLEKKILLAKEKIAFKLHLRKKINVAH